MATVKIKIDYLEKGKTINAEIKKKRPHLAKKKKLFHHDKAPRVQSRRRNSMNYGSN